MDYVQPVFHTNAAYCRLYQHQWIPFSSASHFLKSKSSSLLVLGVESDARWEKVALVKNLLSLSFSQEIIGMDTISELNISNIAVTMNGVEYLVWMDADMIIVDFQKDFLQYWIEQYPSHDILISGEFHAETGVANTGCFIVKKTSWSYRFFQAWWDEDHRRGHDQILFDVLYKTWSSDPSQQITNHIQLLPINALNSVPPAYLTFSERDTVLHLMGERNDYRQKVFEYIDEMITTMISNHVNDARIEHVVELGVSRQYLANSLLSIAEDRIPTLLQQISTLVDYIRQEIHLTLQSIPKDGTLLVFNETNSSLLQSLTTVFTEFRELCLQHGQILSHMKKDSIPDEIKNISLKRIDWLSEVYNQWYSLFLTLERVEEEHQNNHLLLSSLRYLLVEVLNTVALLGNDYIAEYLQQHPMRYLSESEAQDILDRYEKIVHILQLLVAHVAPGRSQRQVWSMLSILWQNRAMFYHQRAYIHTDKSVNDYWERSIQDLHQAERLYAQYLVPNTVDISNNYGDNAFDWIEEHQSYHYRLALLYQQVGDTYCAPPSAVTANNDDKLSEEMLQSGLTAYENAAHLWEDLLKLTGKIEDNYKLSRIWQEDHQQYAHVLHHALECIQEYTTGETYIMKWIQSKYTKFYNQLLHLQRVFPDNQAINALIFQSSQSRSLLVEKIDGLEQEVSADSGMPIRSSARKKFRRKKKSLD